MTNRELIAQLAELPLDTEVFLSVPIEHTDVFGVDHDNSMFAVKRMEFRVAPDLIKEPDQRLNWWEMLTVLQRETAIVFVGEDF